MSKWKADGIPKGSEVLMFLQHFGFATAQSKKSKQILLAKTNQRTRTESGRCRPKRERGTHFTYTVHWNEDHGNECPHIGCFVLFEIAQQKEVIYSEVAEVRAELAICKLSREINTTIHHRTKSRHHGIGRLNTWFHRRPKQSSKGRRWWTAAQPAAFHWWGFNDQW